MEHHNILPSNTHNKPATICTTHNLPLIPNLFPMSSETTPPCSDEVLKLEMKKKNKNTRNGQKSRRKLKKKEKVSKVQQKKKCGGEKVKWKNLKRIRTCRWSCGGEKIDEKKRKRKRNGKDIIWFGSLPLWKFTWVNILG